MKTDQYWIDQGGIPHDLVGFNRPSVMPSADPAVYGTATLTPTTPVEVRSYQTFTLTFTVGSLGIDDTGGIRVAWRFVTDAGQPQFANPSAPNFVRATSNGEGRLVLSYSPNGGYRPFGEILTIKQAGGYLKPGDVITVVFGCTEGGGPGMLMPTFADYAREFLVLADVQATGNFVPLPDHQLTVPVIAGPPVTWRAVLPSLRRPNEPFRLGIKAEDKWGNPTAQVSGTLALDPSMPVENLPKHCKIEDGCRSVCLEDLRVDEPGKLTIAIKRDGVKIAEAGPLIIREGDVAGFWGDLHGQSGETVGTSSAEYYFDFARDIAFLDVASHQGNDFQINQTFWKHLNGLTAEIDTPDYFTLFPGYEWSGNTAVGGDHNVFFRLENATIRRCSHALLEDRSEMDSDANTLTDLYRDLKASGDDAVMYAHVGGRYADVSYDHDPILETAVEVHSDWGSFEWILTDCLKLGHRVGVVCNSDGHKGRPGASYPGVSEFGAYGGVTCFLTERNDRDHIFEAMRRRHHYGTTGCRMFMDVKADVGEGTLFMRNPAVEPDCETRSVSVAQMGDIVRSNATSATLNVELHAHCGIERVEVRRGEETLLTHRSYGEGDLGQRIRTLWTGAEYRGRGRHSVWQGRCQVNGAKINAMTTINHWNLEKQFEQIGSNTVVFNTITTGNIVGFDAWLDSNNATININCNRGDLSVDLSRIGIEDQVLDAGGLERKLRVTRLPNEPLAKSMQFECDIERWEDRDTPIWIVVTTEDGNQAWSSPIYLIP